MAAGRTTQVLVIGDDRETASFLESSLSTLGFEVVQAHNGMQALEEMHAQEFDLIISEFKMPRIGAVELWAEVEKQAPWALRRFCFLIHDLNVFGVRSFLAKTGARYLQKPFAFDEIAGIINDILIEQQPSAPPGAG